MKSYNLEIKQITNFYSKVKQSKIEIIIIYLKDFYIKLKNYIFSIIKKFKRTQKFTKNRYNIIWNSTNFLDFFNIENKKYYLHKHKNFFLAHECLTTKIQQFLIIKKIFELKPNSVLEIGCGTGITLRLLSDIFDKTFFYGVDQSEIGIQLAKKRKLEKIDAIFKEQLNFKFNDLEKPNLEYYVQDARALEFEDLSIDTVFSNLALEQMDNIKFDVLSEIKRVAKKNIILIEPFQNLNKVGLSYLHHKSKQYFNLSHKQLIDQNFEIVEFYDDLPTLLSLKYGMLVLQRINTN